MENLYNRVENLDEQISSVKLPYMAWKVLFLVDKDSDSNKIASILEADIAEVNSSLALLIENNLVTQSETSADVKEKDEESTTEPEIAAVEETPVVEELPEEPPVAEELIEENPPEEEEEQKEQELVDEAETAVSDDEFEVDTEIVESPAEEVPTEQGIEEIAVEDDTVIEPISEEGTVEEGDDIEIKISGEEEPESTEDMEFNFNLTGDEEKEVVEETEETPAEEAVQEEPKQESMPATEGSSGKKNILVIDDSLVIRKMVEIALEDEDFNISTAVSGKEGLDSLDKVNPDLVILDMMLPDINGIEILKTIKASKGIPVIMLSGKDSPQMIESAKNEGAEEFLPKPFKDDDLVQKIKNLL